MPELRDLPAVDTLLGAAALEPLIAQYGVQAVRDGIRAAQAGMRAERSVPDWAIAASGYASHLAATLRGTTYTAVFNLTGTIIHTNLGRSLVSKQLWRDVEDLVTRPMNLEYDLVAGRRGDRDGIVEARIKRLTGCEAATIVNNNAAALMLVLNTFALNKKVPVSRGELIEIGGSFRLPELMARSGCELLEVGTTNRTHARDFEAALDEAAMLLKVHPSNYFISGFSAEVSARELAELAQQADIPSCVDLGSGSLVDLTRWGLPPEPTPQSVLADGIDLVTFSGDKLLGGAQAGIIAGNKTLVDQIRKNPLKRALRADKMTLAVLERTLKLYEDPETLPEHLPLLAMLTCPIPELEARAAKVTAALPAPWQSGCAAASAQIGSGALPDRTIESVAVTVEHPDLSADEIARRLRELPTPVIGRISEERVHLDMRAALPLDELLENLKQLAP